MKTDYNNNLISIDKLISLFSVENIGDKIIVGDNFNISFNNAAATMTIIVILIVIFFQLTLKRTSIIPHKSQALVELIHDSISKITSQYISQNSEKFFHLIFALSMFLLVANITNSIPFLFPITANLSISLALSFLVIISSIYLAIYNYKFKVLSIFLIPRIPLLFIPFAIILSIIIYLFNSIFISIKIFGYTFIMTICMYLVSVAVVKLGATGILLFLLSIILAIIKLLLGFLQSYLLIVTVCMFINQSNPKKSIKGEN